MWEGVKIWVSSGGYFLLAGEQDTAQAGDTHQTQQKPQIKQEGERVEICPPLLISLNMEEIKRRAET